MLRDGCERKASFLTEAEWGESVAGKGCEERACPRGGGGRASGEGLLGGVSVASSLRATGCGWCSFLKACGRGFL